MNFLLVDRNSTMRSIVRHELVELGYKNVHQVGNAESALLTMARHSIDIVITELELPGMSGLEFIQAVRKNTLTQDTKILVVSSSLSREELVHAMQAGANSCLVKPFSPNTFAQHLNHVIGEK